MRAPPRLAELIGDRLRQVTGAAHDVLDVLAVWDSVGLAALDTAFGSASIEALERAGLVEVRVDGRRREVGFAHPLYGEVLCADMPTMTRHRLLLEGADRIERWGARRRTDPLHVATARLEAVGSADADLLIRAARIARAGHDFGLVDRLTSAAAEAPASAELVLLRSEALHELRRYEEVERLLAPVTDGPTFDVQLVAMRVRNLMWGLDRAEDALALNRAALAARRRRRRPRRADHRRGPDAAVLRPSCRGVVGAGADVAGAVTAGAGAAGDRPHPGPAGDRAVRDGAHRGRGRPP